MSLSNAYHSPRMRSGPSAFTLRVLLRHENCAGGESGNWTMTLPPPGGWTRRGPRQIMRPSSWFTSPADVKDVHTAAAGMSASVVKGATRTDRPRRASQERLRRRGWYQFCIRDIVSALRKSMHGVRTFTESVFLQRTTWPRKRRRQRRPRRQQPRRWQRRAQRKRSSRDPRPRHCHLLLATPDAKRNLSKGSELSFAAVRYRGKVRLGRAFVQMAAA